MARTVARQLQGRLPGGHGIAGVNGLTVGPGIHLHLGFPSRRTEKTEGMTEGVRRVAIFFWVMLDASDKSDVYIYIQYIIYIRVMLKQHPPSQVCEVYILHIYIYILYTILIIIYINIINIINWVDYHRLHPQSFIALDLGARPVPVACSAAAWEPPRNRSPCGWRPSPQ